MGHISLVKLKNRLVRAKREIHVGGKYYHYKHPDKFYTIINIGILENTEEVCVMYKSEDGIIWVRPIDNFLSKVELNGQMVPRFTPVES